MKNNLRSKKLTLKAETLRLLDANQLAIAKGGGTSTILSTVYSEGACETYSWVRACLEQPQK
jgi:hypothetical protein